MNTWDTSVGAWGGWTQPCRRNRIGAGGIGGSNPRQLPVRARAVSEGDDLVRPDRPVAELFEGGSVDTFD